MMSDFSGLGTNVMISRLLADLVASAYGAVSFAARQATAARRAWLSTPLSANADELVGQVVRTAVESGCLKLSTAEKYRRAVLRFVAASGRGNLTNLSPELAEKHLQERAAHGLGNGGLRVELAALRTVLDRLLGMRTTAELNYAARPEPIVAASRELTTALLDAVADDHERILVLLLNALKLRPGQIAGLRAEHVRLTERVLVVPHGRLGTYTLTTIPDALVGLLDGLLHQASGHGWLFYSPARPDRPLTVRALQKRLARIASRCGQRVTCTAIRKAGNLLQPADDARHETVQQSAQPTASEPTMHLAAARLSVSFTALAPATTVGLPRLPTAPEGDSVPDQHQRVPSMPWPVVRNSAKQKGRRSPNQAIPSAACFPAPAIRPCTPTAYRP